MFTARDIEVFAQEGRRELALSDDDLITPLARDEARARAIAIEISSSPDQGDASPSIQPIEQSVREVVLEVLAERRSGSTGTAQFAQVSTAIRHIPGREVPLAGFSVEGDDVDVRLGEAVAVQPGFPMSAGLVTVAKGHFPWRLDYDEVVYVIEGELHVSSADGVAVASAGDFVLLAKGSDVTYGSPSWSKFVYVTHPAAVMTPADS